MTANLSSFFFSSSGLYELWKTGKYKNYSPDVLIDLLAKILALVPPWTRVYRIQRYAVHPSTIRTLHSVLSDIPMPLVTSGVEHGNIRELVLKRMDDLGLPCRDVRTRYDSFVDSQPRRCSLMALQGGWHNADSPTRHPRPS